MGETGARQTFEIRKEDAQQAKKNSSGEEEDERTLFLISIQLCIFIWSQYTLYKSNYYFKNKTFKVFKSISDSYHVNEEKQLRHNEKYMCINKNYSLFKKFTLRTSIEFYSILNFGY